MAAEDNRTSSGQRAAAAAATAESESGTPAEGGRQWLLVGLVVVLLAVQTVALIVMLQNRGELSDLKDQVAALDGGITSGDITDLGQGAASAVPSTSSASTGSASSGNLPRFLGGGTDPALGRTLGELASLEYYTGDNTVIDPTDGKSRAYMVWAHWCPYCQEELPLIADWERDNGEGLEGFELVTVTSAIDDTADNPLVPYLDSSEFPFPVLVDEDGSLAQRLGVNAFPFWVFTAPDGSVVGRAAGAIDIDALRDVISQLNDLAGQAAGAVSAG